MTARTTYNLIILLLFHIIGLVLFMTVPNASNLSYVTLLISGIVLIIDEELSARKWAVVTGIVISGYLIELMGTQTGLLFGDYSYGSSLGTKFLGVPLIIGLNWLIIVIASSSISKNMVKSSVLLQAFIAALLCTFLDVIIEPIAIKYDFWDWENGTIPMFNYFCWFGFSFVFSWLYLHKNVTSNHTASIIYIIWLVFFVILNLV